MECKTYLEKLSTKLLSKVATPIFHGLLLGQMRKGLRSGYKINQTSSLQSWNQAQYFMSMLISADKMS